MSLNYLTTYYDYADSACASPVSEINYYPTATLAACQAAAANVSGCATSSFFLAFEAKCITTGFTENGAEVFGSASSYVEAYVYTSASCSDATSLVNLRQYRIGGCYQFSGADGFGGKSRRGALASGSAESFLINIYNDTACNDFYQAVTFLADNTTCQNTNFFNAGSYVKMHAVVVGSATSTSTADGGSSGGGGGGGGGISTGAIVAIVVVLLLVLLVVAVLAYWYKYRKNRKSSDAEVSHPQSTQDDPPPEYVASNDTKQQFRQQEQMRYVIDNQGGTSSQY
ncbi:hypothetical protein HDU83_000939 [Entophlyctis luteolus]|nr:hypothetical protein HDU83_000939 [Entophlyctis luteolus]